MAKDNEAWFDQPKVEGFEYTDCPHGVVLRTNDEETYPFEYECNRCGLLLEANEST